MRDCRFSSVRPAGSPPRSGRQGGGQGAVGLLDGDGGDADAEVGGERHRVGDRALARVARGHGDPVHLLGAEGVDRHRCDQRGVDAARQPDERAGEVVLPHVVTRAEHQGLVHLGVGPRAPATPGWRAGSVSGEPGGPADQDRSRRAARGSVRRRAHGPGHCRDRQVGHQQRLGELGRRGHDGAASVHHQGRSVEDQLVLAADLVHVDDGAARLGHPVGEHPRRSSRRPARVGRGVEVDEQLGPPTAAWSAIGPPANHRSSQMRHPDRHAGHLETGGPARRRGRTSAARRRPRSWAAAACGSGRPPARRRRRRRR